MTSVPGRVSLLLCNWRRKKLNNGIHQVIKPVNHSMPMEPVIGASRVNYFIPSRSLYMDSLHQSVFQIVRHSWLNERSRTQFYGYEGTLEWDGWLEINAFHSLTPFFNWRPSSHCE